MDARNAVRQLAGSATITSADEVRARAKELLEGIGDLVRQYVYGTLHPKASSSRINPNSFAGQIGAVATTDTIAVTLPDYAENIEHGRKPGGRKVPISELLRWMKARGITPRRNQTMNDVAFAIQHKIFEHGIKARRFLVGTEEYLDQLVEALIDEVLLPELVGLIDAKLSD